MIISELFETPQQCPECGGISFSNLILAEKKDACYYKVKASAKVWPSAYASGRLVQCRKKGAGNYGNKSEGVAEGSLNEFAIPSGNDGDSGRWYNDDELADIIGDDWFEDFDVSNDGFNIDAYGEKAKKNLVGYANTWFDDKGYDVHVMGVEHNDVDHDLQWYIVGSFHNPRFANESVAEEQELDEKWSKKYKSSINCANPRGFSQKAHCAGRNKNEDVAENAVPQLSVQQLAAISDEALDQAYGYGRSTPSNTFGWQANLKSAAYAKQMIDQGVTDIEAISDAIHKGWNTTAQAFVQDPEQFDDTAKLAAAGKLEAKLQQRAQLMKQNYAQLPEEEKEKDRVVARALLQAIRGEQQQGVAEDQLDEKSVSQAQFRTMAGAAHNPEFARKVGISQDVAQEFNQADKKSNYKKLPARANEGGVGSGRPDPTVWDTSPGKVGRVEKTATGLRHYADPSRYGGTIPEPEHDKLLTPQERWRMDKITQPIDDMDEGEQQPGADYRDPKEVDYDDEYDAMVARVKKLAGLGPMKTVYDPAKRQYRNMPTAVQPKK